MDFLNKIKSYISGGGRKQWKKEVQAEKKQKYLFGGGEKEDLFFSSRKNNTKQKLLKVASIPRYFQEKIQNKDRVKVYGHWMASIGIFLMVLCTYIIVFSPYFKISPNQVIVEAVTPGVDISVAYRAMEGIYGESIFTLDEASIAKKLKAQLNNLASVSIDRLYPNGLKVLVTAMPIVANVTISNITGKKWGISENGILIPEKDIGDSQIPYHLNITNINFESDLFLNYKQGIGEEDMRTILAIYDIFSKEWPVLKIGTSQYFSIENELHIVLESGTKIIFALQDDSSKKIGNLPKGVFDQLVSLKTYIANNSESIKKGTLIYVDARIPGKIFSCSDPVLCKKNLSTIYEGPYK